MKKQISYLDEDSYIFNSYLTHKDYGSANTSKWQLILNTPSIRKKLKKLAICANKSLSLSEMSQHPLLVPKEIDRFTLTTKEISNTIIELKIYT
ncbi:hypothetical protein [Sphingobacterium sp. SYP-B4668]|uniref:hypothetical protein n=1 Tax=Sphingobacterium sp. SYP-B4668 TaxID=2996035 RepID=UPI0022DDB850|nr:hypothetical protein [Sphingobacterium sp. SYP-B4668]